MRRIREKLETVILPIVEFENANAEEALEFLRYRLSQVEDPSLRELIIFVAAPLEFKEPPSRTPENAPLNIETTNISAWDLLKRIASDCRMKIQPADGGIELIPLGPEPGGGK